jgi:hypothetical protein
MPQDTQETPEQIIDRMIALRIEQNKITQKINTLQAQFFEACHAQNTDQIQHDQALIYKRITPGKWTYSSDILAIEEELKAKRKEFQQSHEPTAGREETWGIRLLLDET